MEELNTQSPSCTIIISAFNEELNVDKFISEIENNVTQCEIILVHGGNDNTLLKAKNIVNSFSCRNKWVFIKNNPDLGKGHAIRTGMLFSTGEKCLQYDADCQFSGKDLNTMFSELDSNSVVIGSRFSKQSDKSEYRKSFFRDTGNKILSYLVKLLCNYHCTDCTTGAKGWTRKAWSQINPQDNTYSYEAEIIMKAAFGGLSIKEIPVKYRSRSFGTSMHKSNFAVCKAGLVIALKCIGWSISSKLK